MENLDGLLGYGRDLTILQMSCRGILVFLIALVLIRISGRRSFGIRTPLDNIVVILLGAILSRAVVGVSPFWPIIVTSFVIVLLRRFVGIFLVKNEKISNIVEGEKIVLFDAGEFLPDRLKRAMVSKEDIMQGVRKATSREDLAEIEKIYIEPSGEITMVKKSSNFISNSPV